MKASLTLLTILLLGVSHLAQANQCHTPRHEVEFKISGQTLTFFSEKQSARSVAQAGVQSTLFREGKSVTQVFVYEGNQHIIHLNNADTPDSYRDYYMVTNDKGESMLYPLHCSGTKALVSLR